VETLSNCVIRYQCLRISFCLVLKIIVVIDEFFPSYDFNINTLKNGKIKILLLSKQYFNLLQLKMTLVTVSKCSTTLVQLSLAFTFLLIVYFLP